MSFVIEREIHNLTKEEEKKFHKEVVAAKEKELKAWVELEAIEPILRSEGRNVMTGRWVLRWKLVDGCKVIKARLVIRGFMDRQQGGLDTASFTARRTSQRMVLSVAVQYGWRLFSWDIGNAFLRGLSFEELAAQQGGNASETLREACFDPPADVYTILQGWNKFKGANKFSHMLRLLKGAYGFKDAPKLWKKRLEEFFNNHEGEQSMLDSCVWM